MIDISREDFATLCICALRYCQGRQTYMPSLVRDICRPHLHEFEIRDLNVMIEDCKYQDKFDLYGDEKIDKPGWLKWKDELLEEYARRAKDEENARLL